MALATPSADSLIPGPRGIPDVQQSKPRKTSMSELKAVMEQGQEEGGFLFALAGSLYSFLHLFFVFYCGRLVGNSFICISSLHTTLPALSCSCSSPTNGIIYQPGKPAVVARCCSFACMYAWNAKNSPTYLRSRRHLQIDLMQRMLKKDRLPEVA